VVCLRSAGSPESIPETMDGHANEMGVSRDEFIASLARSTLLKRLPSLTEDADTAVLMASGYASAMTGAVANITCGQVVD
jgi:hypothetical protein